MMSEKTMTPMEALNWTAKKLSLTDAFFSRIRRFEVRGGWTGDGRLLSLGRAYRRESAYAIVHLDGGTVYALGNSALAKLLAERAREAAARLGECIEAALRGEHKHMVACYVDEDGKHVQEELTAFQTALREARRTGIGVAEEGIVAAPRASTHDWYFHHLGDLPHVIDYDGHAGRHDSATDAYEVRIRLIGQAISLAPEEVDLAEAARLP